MNKNEFKQQIEKYLTACEKEVDAFRADFDASQLVELSYYEGKVNALKWVLWAIDMIEDEQ